MTRQNRGLLTELARLTPGMVHTGHAHHRWHGLSALRAPAGRSSKRQSGPACGPRVEVVQPVLDALPSEERDHARRQWEGSTMSEIRTLVDGVTAAWNNHDAAAFVAQFSKDGVLRIIATGEVMHGRDELRADAEALLGAFPDLRMEDNRTYECGEAVCVIEWTLTGTHEGEYIGIPPTHRLVELPACSIFTLNADRLIGEEVVYFDAATLLRQLGVLMESADGQPS